MTATFSFSQKSGSSELSISFRSRVKLEEKKLEKKNLNFSVVIYAADTVDPVGLDFEREDQKENARKTKNPDNPRFYEKIAEFRLSL